MMFSRQVNRVHILDFARMTVEMRQTLTDRLRTMYTRAEGQVLYTSDAWRRLLDIQGPLVREFMLEFFSTCKIDDTEMGLDTADTLCFQLGRARRSLTWRQFILALGLHIAEEMALGHTGAVPSYTSIRGPLRNICHRLIMVSILDRGQAPEKVTATNLFYLKSMDEGTTVNVPYLLAQYLFRHAEGRKYEARLFGRHFVGRLAEHFGLVTKEGLYGLTMVAPGPERQPDAEAGSPKDFEGAHFEVASDQAVLAPRTSTSATSCCYLD
nr:hypothetical protein [Tanacetum cinerariifolium]